jgi:predicted DCC family thiol-disulfide oxidoreductase YuxK
MSESAPQAPSSSEGRHLVLYDGVCALCNAFTRFVLKRDSARIFHFASLQSRVATAILERFGASPAELSTVHVVADYRSAEPLHLTKSRAVLFVVAHLGGPWKAARVFERLPRSVTDLVYDVVARYRYRVFGRYEVCPIPRPHERGRFIDWQADTDTGGAGA